MKVVDVSSLFAALGSAKLADLPSYVAEATKHASRLTVSGLTLRISPPLEVFRRLVGFFGHD